jgi:hypothetical protein
MSYRSLDEFGRCGESLLQGVCGVADEVEGQGVYGVGMGSGSMGRLGHTA